MLDPVQVLEVDLQQLLHLPKPLSPNIYMQDHCHCMFIKGINKTRIYDFISKIITIIGMKMHD